jgi:hypothetical protein
MRAEQKDLGQLRASEAGSGFESRHPLISNPNLLDRHVCSGLNYSALTKSKFRGILTLMNYLPTPPHSSRTTDAPCQLIPLRWIEFIRDGLI